MSYPAPNYTQVPNILLDDHIKKMAEAELRVVLVIVRETFGWHRKQHKISLTQLCQATGLSRQGVLNGIESGINRGIITRTPQGQGYLYELNISSEKLVNQVDQSASASQPSRPVASQPSRPVLVNQVDGLPPTLKKDLKKEDLKKEWVEEDHPPIGNSPAPTTPQPAPAPLATPMIALAEKVAEAESFDGPKAAVKAATVKAKPAKPKAEPLIYDPRKLIGGYIPAGKGETAIEVYFERYSPAKYTLNKPQQDDIQRVVTDLDVWRNAVGEWSLAGHKATDIGGMLDWYRFPERLPSNRFKPGTTYANGTQRVPAKPATATPATPTAVRRRQFREWLLSNYHTDQPKAVANKTTQELEHEFNEWYERQTS